MLAQIKRRKLTMMLTKLMKRNILINANVPVRYSALFINGPKATESCVFVVPHVDFAEIFKQKEKLLDELKRRKSSFDFCKLEDLWFFYQDLHNKKQELNDKRTKLSQELGQLIRSEPQSENVEKYKVQINLLKENLKKIKEPLWSAEEAAIVQILNLPNTIHEKTPDELSIIHSYGPPPSKTKDHLQIGKDMNIINFEKNDNYYLRDDAAIFELGAKFHFSNVLKMNKFVQFSNADFVKSVILEGCGEDPTNTDNTFILHQNEDTKINIANRLHLTGAGSLPSFLAYYAKNIIYPKYLPLKLFSMGRQYVPSPCDEDSLLNVSQSSVIQLFGVTKNAEEVDKLLEETIEMLKIVYIQLGHHFRLCLRPADELTNWESLRVVIEMFSTSMNSYVEVGNISISGNYMSKRLMLRYFEDKEYRFPHIISGTILNVQKLLACILEQDKDFKVPDQFKVENWNI